VTRKDVKTKINLRINIEGELLDKFNFLRSKTGIFTGTDLVRYLIVQAYNREIEKEKNK